MRTIALKKTHIGDIYFVSSCNLVPCKCCHIIRRNCVLSQQLEKSIVKKNLTTACEQIVIIAFFQPTKDLCVFSCAVD